MADPPQRWTALGFSTTGGTVELDDVSIELGAAGSGITGWRLRGIEAVETIDGLITEVERQSAAPGSGPHPNGALSLDHVVVLTPDFERTTAALTRAGLGLRRVRQASPQVRQGFRRLGSSILEVVEAPDLDPGPARFWGLVVTVADLDRLAERLGDRLGAVRPAVQPGRQIATLRGSAGLGEAVAFMSPEPTQASATLD